jgi:phosphate starvation-inducible membrane PsiE
MSRPDQTLVGTSPGRRLHPGRGVTGPSARPAPGVGVPSPAGRSLPPRRRGRRPDPQHLAPVAAEPWSRDVTALHDRGPQQRGAQALSLGLLLAAVTAMVVCAVQGVPRATDTGLITVVPISFWVTVALLLSGVTVSVWSVVPRPWLAAAHVSVLVVALYGVGTLSTPYPRGTVPWRHVGVATELVTSGGVDPTIDAYFGWPGFFAMLASFTGMAGLEDAQPLMRWAPVVNELLLLPPLLVLFHALTRDVRIVWSSITVFYLSNWVDQDYLAPQATSFFLYLAVLGLLLTFFRPPPRVHLRSTRGSGPVAAVWRLLRGAGPEGDPRGPLPPPACGRATVLVLVVVVTSAVIAMHQLTPFAFLLAFVALAVGQRTPVRGLPLVTATLVVLWLSLSATAYLQGNLGKLLAGVGDVAGAAQGGLVERIQGSPGHLLVVQGRLLFSLTIWGLAGLAVLLHYLRGRRDTTAVLLLGAPAVLFGMQSYGGEMLLRIFMFSLPFAAFLAMQLLPRASTAGRRRAAGAIFLSGTLLLTPGFVLVHYGNQLLDQRSPSEVEAIAELYRLAPPGALLVAGNDNTAWRWTEYGQHRHVTLERVTGEHEPQDAATVVQLLADDLLEREDGGLVLLTQAHLDYERLLGRRTPYSVEEVRRVVLGSDRFTVLYRNADAVIARVEGAPREP